MSALPAGGGDWREHLCAALLALVWVSTQPFKVGAGIEAPTDSNIVNQIAFSLAAVMAMASVITANQRLLAAYTRPAYGLMLAWMLVCVITSANIDVSARAFAFTCVVLVIAATAMVLPSGQRRFALMLGLTALAVVVICYAGLLAFPDSAMHNAEDIAEPEHAGSWRGLFDHKNIAGAMMSFFAMIGLYVAQVRSRPLGWLLFTLAVVFLTFTMAKTSMALFPAIMGLAFVAERARDPVLRALVCLTPLTLMLTFTVGSVLLDPVNQLLQAISPGQTFTGRTEIWSFVFDRLAERPLTGFGFEGFWGSDLVKFADQGENETGIAQGMVHGHNSYVDTVITMGLPGLALVALVLLVLPLVDYQKARRFPENEALARLYLRLWLFAIHAACLESFFFRRADPVWFTLILAVLGLRLVSLWRVAR
jgi:O-antigen ligase